MYVKCQSRMYICIYVSINKKMYKGYFRFLFISFLFLCPLFFYSLTSIPHSTNPIQSIPHPSIKMKNLLPRNLSLSIYLLSPPSLPKSSLFPHQSINQSNHSIKSLKHKTKSPPPSIPKLPCHNPSSCIANP